MNKEKIKLAFSRNAAFGEIIHTVGEWKIIDLKSLQKRMRLPIAYRTLRDKVTILEREGVIKGILVGGKKKYVHLTDFGIDLTPFDKTYGPLSAELKHDMLVCRVTQELLEFSNVASASMYHRIEDKFVNPDSVIRILKNDKVYHIGIELELTQKSQTRIKDKYSKYAKSSLYDYCIYIMESKRVSQTYRKFLQDLEPSIHKKFIFVSQETLREDRPILKDSICFHKEKEVSLSKVLGEKSDANEYRESTLGLSPKEKFLNHSSYL